MLRLSLRSVQKVTCDKRAWQKGNKCEDGLSDVEEETLMRFFYNNLSYRMAEEHAFICIWSKF